MPTKGKSKRINTKKTRNNRTIMKWWFVMPIVLFVSIVGYAIVRFAEARPTSGTIMRSGRAISASNYTSKGNGITAASTPAQVTFSREELRNKKSVCAEMWGLGARSRVGSATSTSARLKIENGNGYGGITYTFTGRTTGCFSLDSQTRNGTRKVIVERVGSGSVYVSRIYIK